MKGSTKEKVQKIGKKIGPTRLLISSLIFLFTAIIWGLFIRGTLRAMEIESGSMIPTYEVRDRVIVWYHNRQDLERGSVVIVKPPDDGGADLIKRLVALPGDTVSYRGSQFYLNGNPSPPPGVEPKETKLKPRKEYTLGANEYYVLGDNRDVSYDSEEFGPIPGEYILGEVLYRYAPAGRMGVPD